MPLRKGRVAADSARSTLIRPPAPITAIATRVHGLTDQDVQAAPAWGQIADQVRALLDGAWIAAHNARVE